MVYRKLLLKVFLMEMHMRGDVQLGEDEGAKIAVPYGIGRGLAGGKWD
jgi:hypothetical protein